TNEGPGRERIPAASLPCRPGNTVTPEGGVIMARIRIEDLPVAEDLTVAQEELIVGAGRKSFRPTRRTTSPRTVRASAPRPGTGSSRKSSPNTTSGGCG